MGLTVIVNMLTVAHKGSNGMSISFPDVCKTPTPAGPVPIPYPNIAKSSDVMSGSSTVKMDGGMIMNKGSNMMMSTGDEAGAAMGVVSNKIKGKAEFVNYSFDVKVDGKNVCRLTDPAQTNMGSANSIAPALVQAPLFAMTPQLEACEKTRAKEDKDENKTEEEKKKSTGWAESYVYDPKHTEAFQTVATNRKVLIYIRRNSKYVLPRWIPSGHAPKPHEVIHHGTLKPESKCLDLFKAWLKKFHDSGKPGLSTWVGYQMKYKKFLSVYPPPPLPENYESFYGIVVNSETGEPYKGTGKFKSKWMTGDYDLMDVVMHDDPACGRLTEDAYKNLMHELNKEMGWPGIQHGPQAYWVPNLKDRWKGAEKFNLPAMLTKHLADCAPFGPRPATPVVTIAEKPHREFKILCKELTVVAPGNHVVKLDDDEVVDALICCGCHKEESKKMDQDPYKNPPKQ